MKVLINFFSNIAQNINILWYLNDEPYVNCMKDSALRTILKSRIYPSIVAIRNKCKNKHNFGTVEVDKKEIEKEILNLDQ